MTTLPLILAAQNAIDRFFLPHPASNLAKDFDWAWNFVLGVTSFFFVVVVGAMTLFVIKFRRKHPNQQTSTITHNTPLEIIWTGIPLILVLAIFFIGFKGFLNYDTPASNALAIDVQAKQWQFTFNYPSGASDGNLYLMKGVPVVLNLQSSDVLHALYIPAFRTQRNAVPGRTTQIWFIPEEVSPAYLSPQDPGGFNLFCTQYCGRQHSKMTARVYVYDNTLEGKDLFEKKMIELANPFKEDKDGKSRWIPYAEVGKKFYRTYCAQCHSIDGSTSTGPTWKNLYKSDVKFSSPPGQSLAASASDAQWEDYLSESILQPEAKIVEGYQNQMSNFSAQLSGTPSKDEKRRAIIEFIKSLGAAPYKPAVNPTDNPDLFDAKATKLHPESVAYKNPAATQPAK